MSSRHLPRLLPTGPQSEELGPACQTRYVSGRIVITGAGGLVGRVRASARVLVNPMAIRANYDVFTENVRVVTYIDSPNFGRVAFVAVG